MQSKTLISKHELSVIIQRLACEIIENHEDFSNTVLIGIQPRGVFLLDRLVPILVQDYHIKNLQYGKLDITFFRDDFRRRINPLQANSTEIDILLENKKIILIDDVLFTGRSIRAALTAIDHYGRPAEVELMALIDRRFKRELPIQPTYKGKQVDTYEDEKVIVKWGQNYGEDYAVLEKVIQ